MKIEGVISLHSKYSIGLMAGYKKVEWRKKNSFSNVDFFIEAVQQRKVNLIVYVSSPIGSTCLVITTSKISVGNAYQIYNEYKDIAGITVMDLIEYYNKGSLNENTLERIADGMRLDQMKFKDDAYVIHIEHCYIIEANYQPVLKEHLESLKLKILKGLKSVEQINLDLPDEKLKLVW